MSEHEGIRFFKVLFPNIGHGVDGGNAGLTDPPDEIPVKMPFYWDSNIGDWLSLDTHSLIWMGIGNNNITTVLGTSGLGWWNIPHDGWVVGWMVSWTKPGASGPRNEEFRLRRWQTAAGGWWLVRTLEVPNQTTQTDDPYVLNERGIYEYFDAHDRIEVDVNSITPAPDPVALYRPRAIVWFKMRKPDRDTSDTERLYA